MPRISPVDCCVPLPFCLDIGHYSVYYGFMTNSVALALASLSHFPLSKHNLEDFLCSHSLHTLQSCATCWPLNHGPDCIFSMTRRCPLDSHLLPFGVAAAMVHDPAMTLTFYFLVLYGWHLDGLLIRTVNRWAMGSPLSTFTAGCILPLAESGAIELASRLELMRDAACAGALVSQEQA